MRPPRPHGQVALDPAQRHPRRLGDDRRPLRRASPIAFGPVVLPYLLIQAVLGFSLLEVVNYLEHYGLLRQKREDGRYERCLPEHSWNSNNVASNVLLYHLQRHSDHHANPTRRYQALRHVDEAPQLPTGYAGMIVLAWFPPLWRRVMDPRLLDHYDGDVTRANVQPRKRGRGSSPATGAARRLYERLALPRLRVRLRRGGRATRARASRRARPGARCPTTGPAPIAASATRSTSSPPRDGAVTASAATMAAWPTARTPYPQAAQELLRETLFGAARDELRAAALVGDHDVGHRRRGRRQPPDPLQGVRQPRRVRPGLRHPRGRALPRRGRGGRPRAPRRPPRRRRRRPRALPPHRRRGPPGPHPAQRRRHRRHAALRHHPGHARGPVGHRAARRRRSRRAGPRPRTPTSSSSPNPSSVWRSATSPPPAAPRRRPRPKPASCSARS